MSLLLDALKKAELAKQIAKADSAAETAGEDAASLPEGAPRVITREKLPDITQPLEILTDDLPSSGQPRPVEPPANRRELSLEDPAPYAPAPQAPPMMRGQEQPAGRAQADQLFQVNEMDYNPRRPFYLTLCALGVAAAGYGGYVWWQMRPQYSFPAATANAGAPAPAPVAPAPVPQPPVVAAAPVQPAQSAPAPAASVQVIPPIQPVKPRPPRQSTAATMPVAPRPDKAPVAAPAAQADSPPIAVNARTLSVDPSVEQGYLAFQKNDLAAARESYLKALARDANNRDALLGLAAIDVRSGQLEAAEARYLKVLEMDPRDGQATAALVSLRGRLDPVASESRLKTLIANQPEAAQLHFALGNQYAHQSRWTEAQAAYFKAYSIDPENADYAFNLAVSLDQLRQKKTALEYYQRALALAGRRPASFDSAQARARVQELSR